MTQHYVAATRIQLQRLQQAPYSVAIFSTTEFGSAGQIISGFMHANIHAENPLDYTMHTAFGADRDLIKVAANELLEHECAPHLVITIGAACTDAYAEVATEAHSTVPLLYVASAGVGPSLSRSLLSVMPATGIEIEKGDMSKIAHYLWQAKPQMKRLLLPYLPAGINGYLDQEANIIKDFFTAQGVAVTMIPIYSLAHGYKQICQHLPQHDTLLLLEGDLALERHRAFAYECIRHGVTLFACIDDAPAFGSVMGYGMDLNELGTRAFSYGQRIVYDGVAPQRLPVVTVPDKRTLYGNLSLAKHQGIQSDVLARVSDEVNALLCEPAEVLEHLQPRG